MEKVLKLQTTTGREVTGIHFLAIMAKRRVQPLRARVHVLWEYSGASDPTRSRAVELSDAEAEKLVRGLTKLTDEEPCEMNSPVAPYETSNPLPEGHKIYESMPPLPEDGPVLHNEPLDAGSDDEVASLAIAHTPEADEGDTEVQGKQKRAHEEEDTADSEEKEGNETESNWCHCRIACQFLIFCLLNRKYIELDNYNKHTE